MDYYTPLIAALLLAWPLVQGFNLLVALTTNRSRKLPPGPFPLPIIGNLHLLGNQPHKSLAKLANFHGPIMSLKLGKATSVVISSSDMAKQVHQKQDLAFSSRSIPDTVQVDNSQMFSVVWLPASHPQWRSLRKILNSHIFSINKLDAGQHLRNKKIQKLVVYCQRSSQIGEAVDIGGAIFRTMLNLLSNTFFSKDLANPYKNSSKEFKDLVEGILIDSGKPNMLDYFPVLKIVDPQGLRRNNSCLGKLLKFFDGLINERLELRKLKGQETTDVLDTLLTASEDNPQDIDRKHIATIPSDLFVAGTDTISNVVEWAMTEILKAPEIMINGYTQKLSVYTLNFFNFLAKFTLIMCGICTSSVSILINGGKFDPFKPFRGIRQGDLMSPYIFMICMKRLPRDIDIVVVAKNWSPIRITTTAPKISHLFFADDFTLFVKENHEIYTTIVNTIRRFNIEATDSSGKYLQLETYQ